MICVIGVKKILLKFEPINISKLQVMRTVGKFNIKANCKKPDASPPGCDPISSQIGDVAPISIIMARKAYIR